MSIYLPGTRTTTTFTQPELMGLPWISGQISIPQSEHIGREHFQSGSGGNVLLKCCSALEILWCWRNIWQWLHQLVLGYLQSPGTQAVTTCGLSSLASFLKILSSKRVCCVFRDIRDKNAVNQGFWSKTLQAFKK